MRPNEPQVAPDRVAVPETAPNVEPTPRRTGTAAVAVAVAVAVLTLLLGSDTLPKAALFAAGALGASAGGLAWIVTWVIDLHHGRAARAALLTAAVTTTVMTALGVLAIELGSAVVPLVGVLAVGTSIIVAKRSAKLCGPAEQLEHGAPDGRTVRHAGR